MVLRVSVIVVFGLLVLWARVGISEEFGATRAWLEQLNGAAYETGVERFTELVRGSELIDRETDRASREDGDVCRRFHARLLPEELQRLSDRQDFSGSDRLDVVASEWQHFFSASRIWLCEWSALEETEVVAEYRHAYLFETGRGRDSKRLLLQVLTRWPL